MPENEVQASLFDVLKAAGFDVATAAVMIAESGNLSAQDAKRVKSALPSTVAPKVKWDKLESVLAQVKTDIATAFMPDVIPEDHADKAFKFEIVVDSWIPAGLDMPNVKIHRSRISGAPTKGSETPAGEYRFMDNTGVLWDSRLDYLHSQGKRLSKNVIAHATRGLRLVRIGDETGLPLPLYNEAGEVLLDENDKPRRVYEWYNSQGELVDSRELRRGQTGGLVGSPVKDSDSNEDMANSPTDGDEAPDEDESGSDEGD